ncbi:outer membrane efflux protein [Cupriavidus basilensis OR16]|uniref:Outer membrane efflux protein n=1 Tax=Cupriavidus basilensis OR16 TaxID=1127483 RepID=H1SB72_9BURK|nr:TolC family protein [Cupriavidus basilensis]EHP40220.1 outer membrane efflux protein [Cupriavidus basilensis OR16]
MRTLVMPLGLAAALLSPAAFAQNAVTTPLPAAQAAQQIAEPADVLTLDDALALAAGRNFTLSAAGHELDAAEGGIMQARTIPNPEVAVLFEDNRRDTRTTTAQVNLPIELGGKRAARIGAAQKAREFAQSQLGATRTDLRAAVLGGFFAVVIAQERVKLARGSAEIAAKGAQAAIRRVAAGKIAPLEESKARVEQANAELEVADAEAALAIARQSLAGLWGSSEARFQEAAGNLDTLPARPDGAGLTQALDSAPELASRRLELERRQAIIGVERSRQYPDLTISLGSKRDNGSDRGTMPVLGVSLPLPLFDRNQGNLYAALRQADKAADEYRATQVRLANELQQATRQLTVSRSSADTLKGTVLPAARQAYEAATRGFEAGKFNFLDVLDAQRTWFQARIRYLGVVANAYQAATTIDRILGR